MGPILLTCSGGHLTLPDRQLVLIDRLDGGNLCVLPARKVWERGELTRVELVKWSLLVAAAARAMLEGLPQLEGGCINYWEAGNWALNDEAPPRGAKSVRQHRRVHLHLLGRSRSATHPAWKWGEAPVFPRFTERFSWAAGFERLDTSECWGIVRRLHALLTSQYEMPEKEIEPVVVCAGCGYPAAQSAVGERVLCSECREESRPVA